jgi:hypothetical protein
MQREENGSEYRSMKDAYSISSISNIRQDIKQDIGVEKPLIH